jgi:hypothetical protein
MVPGASGVRTPPLVREFDGTPIGDSHRTADILYTSTVIRIAMIPPAELHCLSNFSFLRGASHPEELVQRAAELGYAALALTDECSFAGVVRAHREIARLELPLKLIIGTELRLCDGPLLVLLVRDRTGYAALSRLITQARRAAGKGEYLLRREDLAGGVPGCFALLVAEAEELPWDWPTGGMTRSGCAPCSMPRRLQTYRHWPRPAR